MARGPTTPLPPDHDGYRFCVTDAGAWQNRPGRTFTWSNATTVIAADPRQDDITAQLSEAHLVIFRAALAYWAAIADVTWSEVADSANNNLRVGYSTPEQFGTAPGFVTYGLSFGSLTPLINGVYIGFAETHFDAQGPWVQRHEIGHMLGLWHPIGSVTETIMETLGSSTTFPVDAQLGDKIGAWHLYGAASGAASTAPDAVRDFTAAAGILRNDLAWDVPLIDGGSSITGYLVTRTSGGVTTTVTVTGTSYAHTGLGAHAVWSYKVEAVNLQGDGLPSPTLTRTALDAMGEPPDPINSAISWTDPGIFIGTNSIVLDNPGTAFPSSWIVDGETAYLVDFLINISVGSITFQLSDDPNDDFPAGAAAGPSFLSAVRTGLVITLLSGGSTIVINGIGDTTEPYSWTPSNSAALAVWAAARSAGDRIDISVSFGEVAPPVFIPSVPSIPTVSDRGSDQLILGTTAEDFGGTPTLYRWRYSTNDVISDFDPATTSSGPNVTITGLDPDTDYWVDVRAENTSGESEYSEDLATSTIAGTLQSLTAAATFDGDLDGVLAPAAALGSAPGDLSASATFDGDLDGVLAPAAALGSALPSEPDIELEDTSITVEEGDSATIRARLTSEPASNVIVTATETDPDVSVSPSSRTFTPSNWNVYQDWTVTGVQDSDELDDSAAITLTATGGSSDTADVSVTVVDDDDEPSSAVQSLDLLASYFYRFANGTIAWTPPDDDRPQIVSGLTPGSSARFLTDINLRSDGTISVFFDSGQNVNDRADLSSEFENNGSFTIDADGQSLTIVLVGLDISEPYSLAPANGSQVTDFVNFFLTVRRRYSFGHAYIAEFCKLAGSWRDILW